MRLGLMKPLLIICAFIFTLAPIVRAEPSSVEKTIEELKSKIADLQGQETSLSKEITLKNSQISLLQLKNDATKTAITKLAAEIGELTVQIDQLEELKTRRLELALHRAPESYKRSSLPLIGFLLLSQNFSDALSRMKYLSRVQEEDAKSYQQLQLTQSSYNERKDAREKKKTEQEKLKRDLEIQTKDLERTKREKQSLLEQTKNSESVYRQLLAQALAERQAVERAIIDGVKVGPIKKGEPLALVGNTGYPGCSTGAHLHFEVRKNNAWMNPEEYLSRKSVIDDQDGGTVSLGRGSWSWPLEDTVRITQRFGKTPYSWRYAYSGGIHTGLDMVSSGGSVIRAPADGTLYSSSQSCGGSSIIKIKYIEHSDSVVSFYLHVQ